MLAGNRGAGRPAACAVQDYAPRVRQPSTWGFWGDSFRWVNYVGVNSRLFSDCRNICRFLLLPLIRFSLGTPELWNSMKLPVLLCSGITSCGMRAQPVFVQALCLLPQIQPHRAIAALKWGRLSIKSNLPGTPRQIGPCKESPLINPKWDTDPGDFRILHNSQGPHWLLQPFYPIPKTPPLPRWRQPQACWNYPWLCSYMKFIPPIKGFIYLTT